MIPKKESLALALLLIFFVFPIYSQPTNPTLSVDVSARIEYGYALVLLRIDSPQSFTLLRYNITGLEERLALALAEIDGRLYRGTISGGSLVFDFKSEVNRVNITLIFLDAVKRVNDTLILSIPVPLSPVGWEAETHGTVSFGSSRVKISRPTVGKPGTGVINVTSRVTPGVTETYTGEVRATAYKMISIQSLKRTIYIEGTDKILMEENYTLTTLSDSPQTLFTLRFPREYKVLGVEGPLGPYPRTGNSGYNVQGSGDYKIIFINLRAPPRKRGQKTSVVIKVELNTTSIDSTLSLDAFVGTGIYINHYDIYIAVRGEAEIDYPLINEFKKGGYTFYKLKPAGPLFREEMYPKVTCKVNIVPQGLAVMPLILIISLSLVSAALVVIIRARVAKPATKERERVIERIEETEREKIRELIKRRAETFRSALTSWEKVKSRKISKHTYNQLFRRLMRKEVELSKKISGIAKSVADETLQKQVAEIDSLAKDIRRLFKEISRVERSFKSGLLESREYKRRLSELERDIDRRINRMLAIAEEL